MADTKTDTPPAPAAGEPMPITINAQYVKDLSFENPNAPQSLLPTSEQPQLDVQIDVQTRTGPQDTYEVTLHIKADARVGTNRAFLVELAYAGVCTLKGVPNELLQPVLLIEIPRLLFPFARNILADITRDGGFAPLMINPIDFADLYRRHMTTKQAGGEIKAAGNA
jgi:preprotein translocase subunit SecB